MGKIIIFEKEKDVLFAACFHPREIDALDEILDRWRDFEGLRDFFKKYEADLKKFEPSLRIKDAVRQTLEEANKIFDQLIEYSGMIN